MLTAALASLVLLTAGSQAAKLDSETHSELLLQGRPQVGLWKALSAAQSQSDLTSCVRSLRPEHSAYV